MSQGPLTLQAELNLCTECDVSTGDVMWLLPSPAANWTSHTVSFLTVGGTRLTLTVSLPGTVTSLPAVLTLGTLQLEHYHHHYVLHGGGQILGGMTWLDSNQDWELESWIYRASLYKHALITPDCQ